MMWAFPTPTGRLHISVHKTTVIKSKLTGEKMRILEKYLL